MRKKRLKRIVRYKDSALKHIRLLREKFDMKYYYYYEFKNNVSQIRKLPPQYNPHK